MGRQYVSEDLYKVAEYIIRNPAVVKKMSKHRLEEFSYKANNRMNDLIWPSRDVNKLRDAAIRFGRTDVLEDLSYYAILEKASNVTSTVLTTIKNLEKFKKAINDD